MMMYRNRSARGTGGVALALGIATASGLSAAQYQGWLIPAGGKDEKSPLASVAAAATRGRTLYLANCATCHGPEGKGDGSESDHAADLTDDYRTSINTEGVLFYKVWNGHAIQLRTQIDDMPAFEGKLLKDEVWAVVEYLKVLRAPKP
jgi:mono/diheme cytochrome c family protein